MNTKISSHISKQRGLSAFVALLSIGALVNSSSASTVVAEYSFDGGSISSSDTETATIAGDYVATVAPNTTSYSGTSSSSDNAFFFSFQTAANLNDAISSNDYQSFSLDVETAGATVSLESLDFDQGWWNTAASLDFSVSVLSSFDGFATAGELLGTYTIDGATTTDANTTVAQSINLAGLTEFQNLTSDVEFRFYFYDNSSATDRTHRIDNISLTASSVVIPEPSSMAFVFALVSLGSAVSLRRKQKNS